MKNTNTTLRQAVDKVHTLWMVPLFVLALCFATDAQAATKKVSSKKVTKASTKITKTVVAKRAAVPSKINKQASSPRVLSQRSPASLSAGISDSQKSLEIRGQSRNLSMLLVLKNRHENIDFVKPRESYREEITQTEF